VSAIKPRRDNGGNKKLRAVGIGAGVGHGKEAGLVMLQLEVLVGELLTENALAASAVASGEVTTLEHEVRNDTVEAGTRIGKSLAVLAGKALAQLPEVLAGSGDVIDVEVEVDSATLDLDFAGGTAVGHNGAFPLHIEVAPRHDGGC